MEWGGDREMKKKLCVCAVWYYRCISIERKHQSTKKRVKTIFSTLRCAIRCTHMHDTLMQPRGFIIRSFVSSVNSAYAFFVFSSLTHTDVGGRRRSRCYSGRMNIFFFVAISFYGGHFGCYKFFVCKTVVAGLLFFLFLHWFRSVHVCALYNASVRREIDAHV